MQVTIEQINGKPYTRIMGDGMKKPWAEDEMPNDGAWRAFNLCIGEARFIDCTVSRDVCAVFLPPLPRRPKPEDVGLLHLYAAHGLHAVGARKYLNVSTIDILQWLVAGHLFDGEITHALHNGGRVEIAIEETDHVAV